MKNRTAPLLAALAAAVVGLPASAQSTTNVSVYGVVDTGVEYQRATAGSKGPATTRKEMVNGTNAASRIGFRGTEDLGGGHRAFFVLEHGFNSDTGASTFTNFFARKAVVGLGGPWGELSLGRDLTPAFWAQFITDVNTFGLYGNSGTMSAFALTGMLRASNGVNYVSPEFNGFRGRLLYTFGDERETAPKDAGRVIGVSGEYRSPTLSAAVFHQVRRSVFPANSTSSASNTYQGLTGLYNFGDWALSAGLTRFDPAGPSTKTSGVTTSLWMGAILRFANSDLRLNLGQIRTDLKGATDGKSLLVGVNYSYQLSKRTNLYVGVGQVDNNATAQIGLEGGSRAIPNNGLGSDTTVFGTGIRMTF